MQCLLCEERESEVEDQLSGAQIISLWRVARPEISSEAFLPMTAETAVLLYRCSACGFRFYDPSLAGTGRFYEALMARPYYADIRDEFTFALDFASRHPIRTVLDVGGGDGSFLDAARQRGLSTIGLELNAAAAARCASKGHKMISKHLADVCAPDVGGDVDMLTLFQVVEHVPNPVAFVRDAAELVRPGGYIVVAVPNEYRMLGLLPYDPANWPPHHVTRWRGKDLRRLAKLAGLRVVASGADRLHGAALVHTISYGNELARAIRRPEHFANERLASVLSLLYRKLGMKYLFPRLGLSIYVVLQK